MCILFVDALAVIMKIDLEVITAHVNLEELKGQVHSYKKKKKKKSARLKNVVKIKMDRLSIFQCLFRVINTQKVR